MLGGLGLPVEKRDNKTVSFDDYIVTTTGRNLLLVVESNYCTMTTMDVTGKFRTFDRRTVDWNTKLHGNRPSQTHFNRMILANLYGYQCLACGVDDEHLTVDHVVPRAENGWSSLSNLQLLCKTCNVAKADTWIDYRFLTPSELFWLWAEEYRNRIEGL